MEAVSVRRGVQHYRRRGDPRLRAGAHHVCGAERLGYLNKWKPISSCSVVNRIKANSSVVTGVLGVASVTRIYNYFKEDRNAGGPVALPSCGITEFIRSE